MAQVKQYQEVNGTSYDITTPRPVIDILEHSRETKRRLVLVYGNPETGEVWESSTPLRGHIGRSTGINRIPLLIRSWRSLGGRNIDDQNIIEIRATGSGGGTVLYSYKTILAKEFMQHDRLTVSTTAGELFTGGESSLMAFLIFKRFGRDMDCSVAEWRGLLGNSCSTNQFRELVKKGELYYKTLLPGNNK